MKRTGNSIARDIVEYLRENPDVCADISVSAGCFPWVRFHDGDWQMVQYGQHRIEGRVIEEQAVVGYIETNPTDLLLVSEAYQWGPKEKTAWEEADEQDVFTDADRCFWCGESENSVALGFYETLEDGDTHLCPECFESWDRAGEIVGEVEASA